MSNKTLAEKQERFIRIAKSRTDRIITGLQLLGKCSKDSVYAYTKEQVDKVFREIREETDRTEALFDSHGKIFSLNEKEVS